jgi:adenine deaminase
MKLNEMFAIQKVLKGNDFADIIIRNGKIINVFTNEIEEGKIVAIKGRMIFYVGRDLPEIVGENTSVIDAKGGYVAPGFIDTHTHLDSMIPFNEFVPYAMQGGVTTVVTECAMVANACGIKGVLSFVNSTKGYPLKTFFLAPPLVPPIKRFETAHPFSFEEFKKLLNRHDFVGIGEAYWNEAIRNEGGYFRKVVLAKMAKKSVEGHAAGAKAKNLTAYLNCGITSCHESITVEEALEKLRQGVYVMIREGFIRRELDELYKLKDCGIDMRRLILVSDVFSAPMLLEGYMNLVVKRAVSFGFNIVDAVKMVKINPADYFGFSDRGAVAIGRIADINIFDDSLNIKTVIADGKLVVKNGRYLLPIKKLDAGSVKNSLTLKKVQKEELFVKADADKNVIVMEIFSPTIMKQGIGYLKAENGKLLPNLEEDIIPVFLLDRRRGTKSMGTGFIKGTGIKNGSIATSLVWDTSNILALGSDEGDIAMAVNRLIDIGGGMVVVKSNKLIFEFPMPIYGLIPLLNMKEIAKKETELEKALSFIGCKMQRPFLNLQTIAFTGLPFLRLTNKGVVDIKRMKKVSLFSNQ